MSTKHKSLGSDSGPPSIHTQISLTQAHGSCWGVGQTLSPTVMWVKALALYSVDATQIQVTSLWSGESANIIPVLLCLSIP